MMIIFKLQNFSFFKNTKYVKCQSLGENRKYNDLSNFEIYKIFKTGMKRTKVFYF